MLKTRSEDLPIENMKKCKLIVGKRSAGMCLVYQRVAWISVVQSNASANSILAEHNLSIRFL